MYRQDKYIYRYSRFIMHLCIQIYIDIVILKIEWIHQKLDDNITSFISDVFSYFF